MVPFCPPLWRTLAELAALPQDVLAWAHERKKIHPEMERKDVAALKREFSGGEQVTGHSSSSTARRWTCEDACAQIHAFLAAQRASWPTEKRHVFTEVVTQIAVALEMEAAKGQKKDASADEPIVTIVQPLRLLRAESNEEGGAVYAQEGGAR